MLHSNSSVTTGAKVAMAPGDLLPISSNYLHDSRSSSRCLQQGTFVCTSGHGKLACSCFRSANVQAVHVRAVLFDNSMPGSFVCTSGHGKLACSCSRSANVQAVLFDNNMPGSFVCTSGHGKLACACFRSANVQAVLFDNNMPGRVDTLADAGIKMSSDDFIADILDVRYRENGRAAPPAVPCYPPLEEDGPDELDFEIYASNCMAGYEPPPSPQVPFAFPFEDYYGEAVGVDYISKEDMPVHSLLQFLDTLKTKKAAEDAGTGQRPPFSSSNVQASESTEGKSKGLESSGCSNGEDVDGSEDRKEVVNDIAPTNMASLQETEEEEQECFTKTCFEETSEKSSVLSGLTMAETTSTSGGTFITQSSTGLLTSGITTHKTLDSDSSESVHAIAQSEPLDVRSSEDPKNISNSLSSDRAVGDANIQNGSPSGLRIENDSSAPVFFKTESRNDLVGASLSTQHQVKGSPRKTESNLTMKKSILPEDAKLLDLSAGEVGKVTLGTTGTSYFKTVPKSSHYVPKEGELVVGAVTFMNDQKVDLEIGARLPALMALRDVQPLFQHFSSQLFDLSSEADLNVPSGESLLLKDDSVLNSICQTEVVEIGTILIAEVTGKTIMDGRPILSCKVPARRLAWHRMDQLRRIGEAVQIEITQWNEGGLLGSWEGLRVFIPKSELVQKPNKISSLKNYVGRTLYVAVLQADKATFSMTASEIRAWMSKYLQLGTVHDVIVTKVHSYGIQVEIDNTKIRGFVHKSNFSKEFVSSASDYFAEGDKAKVMLIKGRDTTKISFSIADLEKEDGLLLRDEEQVFRDAEEMGRRFTECLSEQERRIYGTTDSEIGLDYQDPEIANLAWLHI